MTQPPKRVWITGANGFIASYLRRDAARFAPGLEVVALRQPRFELTDFAGMDRAFANDRPDLIVHCAAMSRTGDCQADPALARRVNVEATRHLAGLAAGIPLFLFSSDLVFDGTKGDYVEGDPVNPLSVYAETKAEAEQAVLSNPRHSVMRISLTAGTSPLGRAFNEEIRSAWQAGRETPLFTDEFRCPLAAPVVSRAVWELVQLDRPGLYHLAGAEGLSRLAIGEVLARRWAGRPAARIRPTSIRDYAGPRRPADTSLNCARLQSLLSFPLPRFSQWIEEHAEEPV